MKKLNAMLTMLVLAFMVLVKAVPAQAADPTISFEFLKSGSPAISTTIPSTAADFSALNSDAALSGKTIIAILYDTCRTAPSPSVATSDMVMKVVTEDTVTAHGTFEGSANAKWFIVDGKLYITGSTGTLGQMVTISDGTTGAAETSVTTSFTGTRFDIKWPSLMYDKTAGGIGGGLVNEPVVGDEITFSENEWFTYTVPTSDFYSLDIQDRDDISINVRFDGHSSGNLNPADATKIKWKGYESTITDIYISDDIELSGNMNGLFNANFTVIKETGSAGDMGDSLYTQLKNVYLYCDMSKVTGAAGMFARINTLENVYVRPSTYASGLANTPTKMTNVATLAYMFYGDKNLKNDTDSFINAIDLSASDNLVSTRWMYGGCESIQQPNVSSYRMNNVKWADGMFFGAKQANLVSSASGSGTNNIYSWNLSSLIDGSAMFSGGDSDGEINLDNPLSSMDPGIIDLPSYGDVITGEVDMSNWNMTSLQMAGYMFSRNGQNFRGIIFGSNYPALVDASCMFLRSDYLSSVKMNSQMDALKNTTAMFRGAGSKASVSSADLSNWKAPVLEHADLMFADSGFFTIDTTGWSNLSTLKSAAAMFADCPNLASLGEGALSTAVFSALENAEYMFSGDTALVKVSTAAWNMGKAKNISFMFSDCSALGTGVDVSAWVISTDLKDMECFAKNTSIPTFDLSGWRTDYVTSIAFAFAQNNALTTVILPTANNSFYSLKYAIGAFADDASLVTVSDFPTGNNAIIDARGMFANDKSLTNAGVSNIVRSTTKYLSYFMKNCSSIETVDITNWDTPNVEYMQGTFDGAKKLKTITVGTKLSGAKCADAGTLLRNNYVLSQTSIAKVLSAFNSNALVDAYEMLKNCYGMTELDMSNMNFSNTTDLRRIAAMEESNSYETNKLVTIKLPDTILTATGVLLKDTDNKSIHMFWVDGDGDVDGDNEENSSSDDLNTTLYLLGNPGANIIAYNFGGVNGDNDNRTFVKFDSRTINGNGVGTYQLADSTDSAVMKLNATSSLYKGGTSAATSTLVPLTYKWTKGGSTIAGAAEATYTTNKSGTYVANAYPSLLTGSSSPVGATFLIGTTITGITAEYKGPDITVGSNYSKDNVVVKAVDTDGNEIPLTSSDFEVDSLKVTKSGENTYTATYKNGDGTFTAPFTVTGIRNIGAITAVYSGPAVLVGNDYDKSYVTVMAYYTDDPDKKEGFEVTPTSLSSLKVTAAGDNSYTAYYEDKKQDKTFSAQYVVNGYKAIKSIAATYTGDKILVGEQYSVDDVKVTLYYTDGTNATTKQFNVNSKTVTAEGGNSFTATYRDPFGNTYTAGYSVPGYKNADTQSSSDNTASTTPPEAQKVSSTVVAPTTTASSPSTVKTGTNTGVVQTGRTGKLVFYIIVIIFLVIFFVVVNRLRREEKGKGRGKRNGRK